MRGELNKSVENSSKVSSIKRAVDPPAAFFIPASLTITDYLSCMF